MILLNFINDKAINYCSSKRRIEAKVIYKYHRYVDYHCLHVEFIHIIVFIGSKHQTATID